MSRALLNAHAQSVLSIDADDDVQILSTSGTSGTAGAAFESFNNQLIRQIQKVVLGQTLTSGTDGKGSYSLGQVHENVRLDKLKSDIRLVTPTLQAVVDSLCVLNGWSKYTVMLGEKPKPLNKDQAERDVHLKMQVPIFLKITSFVSMDCKKKIWLIKSKLASINLLHCLRRRLTSRHKQTSYHLSRRRLKN